MHIKKIEIEGFKCFKERFSLDLREGLNILVGDNDSGKSTILEAISLALSGWFHGKYISHNLTEALFNREMVAEYLESLQTDSPKNLPEILIEITFAVSDADSDRLDRFQGRLNNAKDLDAKGIQFKICFNKSSYKDEYEVLLTEKGNVKSLPIEYYSFFWSTFAYEDTKPREIPFKSSFIDSSSSRNQNESDVYISRIIQNKLSDVQKVKASQSYRKLKDLFTDEPIIDEINSTLSDESVDGENISLSADFSTKTAWERSLITYVKEIPFEFIGKGKQCLIKTNLALGHQQSEKADVILIEEPENHLSHTKLNGLINRITESGDKQIIISTHNSFVANKLNLGRLIILNESNGKRKSLSMTDLNENTIKFFEKVAGYDTLRLIFCRQAILVEGPSDELIVQKAYQKEKGRLPIEAGVDVISVGTSFLRFLEIAKKLQKPVAVVTDNDGDYESKISQKYANYTNVKHIKICADKNKDLSTLEPQIVEANTENLGNLRNALNLEEEMSKEQIIEYMKNNKTECALKIFETEAEIYFPQYILDAINWEYGSE